MIREIADRLTTFNADAELLRILEWCAETRFGQFFTVTNLVIGLCYAVIPAVIVAYLVWRWRALSPSVRALFVLFAAFVFGCGLTHLAHVALIADPARWMAWAMVAHAFTTVASAVAVFALVGLTPALIRVPTPMEYDRLLQQLEANRRSLHDDKLALTKELNHRVRNTLAIMEANLRLQIAQITDRACRDVLTTALGRIQAISRVHNRIYAEGLGVGAVRTTDFVPQMCHDLAEQFEADIHCELADLTVSADEAPAISLIVNELVTNAVKHGEEPITVCLHKGGEAADYELQVRDHGPGIPPAMLYGRPKSVGLRLIRGIAAQLGGEVSFEAHPEGGTLVTVSCRHYAARAAEAA